LSHGGHAVNIMLSWVGEHLQLLTSFLPVFYLLVSVDIAGHSWSQHASFNSCRDAISRSSPQCICKLKQRLAAERLAHVWKGSAFCADKECSSFSSRFFLKQWIKCCKYKKSIWNIFDIKFKLSKGNLSCVVQEKWADIESFFSLHLFLDDVRRSTARGCCSWEIGVEVEWCGNELLAASYFEDKITEISWKKQPKLIRVLWVLVELGHAA